MTTDIHILPSNNFEKVRLDCAIKGNYPFLCPNCDGMCVIENKIDVGSVDQIKIECNFCNNEIFISTSNQSEFYVETPAFSRICKFVTRRKQAKSNMKNHELYEC